MESSMHGYEKCGALGKICFNSTEYCYIALYPTITSMCGRKDGSTWAVIFKIVGPSCNARSVVPIMGTDLPLATETDLKEECWHLNPNFCAMFWLMKLEVAELNKQFKNLSFKLPGRHVQVFQIGQFRFGRGQEYCVLIHSRTPQNIYYFNPAGYITI